MYTCMHRRIHTCIIHTHTCARMYHTYLYTQNIHMHICMSLYLYIGLLDYWDVKFCALSKELGSVLVQATV